MFCSLSKGVSLENVDGTIVLIDEEGNAAVLNETASEMIEIALEGNSEAISDVALAYRVPFSEVKGDFEEAVKTLCEYGMLVRL